MAPARAGGERCFWPLCRPGANLPAMPDTTIAAIDARRMLLAILAISLAALATAFAGQYLFGLDPCVLCLYERAPWALAAAVAAVGLVGRSQGRGSTPIALCAAIFDAGGPL